MSKIFWKRVLSCEDCPGMEVYTTHIICTLKGEGGTRLVRIPPDSSSVAIPSWCPLPAEHEARSLEDLHLRVLDKLEEVEDLIQSFDGQYWGGRHE